MPTMGHAPRNETCDESQAFIHAVSLIAAMEGATDLEGHGAALPYLGMARAELTDFGQRRAERYVPVALSDLHTGLTELEDLLTAMLARSDVPQHRLRLEAALKMLRRVAASSDVLRNRATVTSDSAALRTRRAALPGQQYGRR